MTTVITATLYDGKYTVEFRPGNHSYTIVGNKAKPDGCTTIAKAIAPFQGDDWAGKLNVEWLQKTYLAHLETHGLPPETSAFAAMCEEATTYHQSFREAAGDRGSEAHKCIEKILTGQPYEVPDNPLVQASLEAFEKWRNDIDCEVVDGERFVFHDDLFYCGCVDVWGKWSKKHAVVDFKTGSGFYRDMPYQLTGYATALEKEFPGLHIDMGYIVHLDKRTSNYKVWPVKIDDGMREAWVNGVMHYKSLKRVTKMVKEMRDGVFQNRAA